MGYRTDSEDEVCLLRLLRVEEDGRSVRRQVDCHGRARLPRLQVTEQLLEPVAEAVADPSSDPDHDPLREVPGVEVVRERLARRALDGLARAEDVPAQRLVGEEQPVVDVADVSLRRVQVDVHLLEDHALFLLDLGRVETRVTEHVDEHVQRDVSCLRRALDVVAGDLLAGEGVELATDRVDLRRDRARRRAALGPLEEHVLGEVRDALRRLGLVARSGGEHHEACDRRHLGHRCGQDADAVRQRRLLEDCHRVRWYRQASCPGS